MWIDLSCKYLTDLTRRLKVASIAQWIEHWSRKPGVVSSILTGGSKGFRNRVNLVYGNNYY